MRNAKPRTFKKTQDQFSDLFNLSFFSLSISLQSKTRKINIMKTWSLEQVRLNVDSTTYLRPQVVLFICLFFHKFSASFLTEYILVLFTSDVETNAVVDCLFVFI